MQHEIKKAFDQICADEALKINTKNSLRQKIYNQKKPYHNPARRKMLYALCASFVLCLVFIGHHLYFTPTTVISVDINPSIEFGVNRFDRVVEVKGYNEDGTDLAASLDVLHENYEDVVSELIQAEWMKTLLDANEILSIAVVQTDEVQGQKILDYVKNCTSNQKNIYCYGMNSEDAAQAHDLGLSCGRYRLYLEIIQYQPQITPEELNQMSMREIRDLLMTFTGQTPQNQNGHGYSGGKGYGANHHTSQINR